MNASIRLYLDAVNAKTKLDNGFELTEYDQRTLKYSYEYADRLLAIDVNIDTTRMLDIAWELFSKYFSIEELGIKSTFTDLYWKK